MFGFRGKQGEDLTRQTMQNLEAITETGTVLVGGMNDVSQEWLSLAQERVQRNLDGLNALVRCRTWQDLVAVQSELVRDDLKEMLDGSRRVAQRSIQVADEAVRTITVQAKDARSAA